ncbi:MAG: hypothetical protein HYX32_00570 [Actinobacteria bacterium]|nr:hypothetical protein [Actinomycetota bacterium]
MVAALAGAFLAAAFAGAFLALVFFAAFLAVVVFLAVTLVDALDVAVVLLGFFAIFAGVLLRAPLAAAFFVAVDAAGAFRALERDRAGDFFATDFAVGDFPAAGLPRELRVVEVLVARTMYSSFPTPKGCRRVCPWQEAVNCSPDRTRYDDTAGGPAHDGPMPRCPRRSVIVAEHDQLFDGREHQRERVGVEGDAVATMPRGRRPSRHTWSQPLSGPVSGTTRLTG